MIERFHTPTSRNPRWLRVPLFDVIAALVAPLAAIGAYRLASYIDLLPSAPSAADFTRAEAMLFFAASLIASLAALAAFRLGDALSRYFSRADALLAGKAVVAAGAGTVLILYLAGRLSVLPRSVLLIDGILFGGALLGGRLVARLVARRRRAGRVIDRRNALLVGCNGLAAGFLRMIEANPDAGLNIAALIDVTSKRVGRTVRGYRISGGLDALASLVDEYKVHGVVIDRVLVAVPRTALGSECLAMLAQQCGEVGLQPEFLDESLRLATALANVGAGAGAVACAVEAHQSVLALARLREEAAAALACANAAFAIPAYHKVKRAHDFAAAALLSLLLLPLGIAVALLVAIDVGAPILFWQRRVGRDGRRFLVYKFRTFHAPYDRFGKPRLERAELSRIGAWLRRTRLDELPQLYNVLTGEMSIVGPRPLLDADMPEGDERRLAVRPGLTGWAQVNGGKLLSADDKNVLDCWYIAHASVWLDAKVLWRTIGMMLKGERDNPEALRRAWAAEAVRGATQSDEAGSRRTSGGASLPVAA